MNQIELNQFMRTYFDLTKKRQAGVIHHDPGTSKEHRRLLNEVAEWANNNGLTYYTRVFLKEKKIVDVVIPELPRPFIEIRDSELKKKKEYLGKYKDMIQFCDVSDPFCLT